MPDATTDTAPTDKVRTPLDTSTVMAFGVGLVMIIALGVSVYTSDKELTRDLAKNFVGPAFLLIIGYYFGSSSSSKRKDETIANQASAAANQ
jgi:hypothetical protein